MKKMMQALVFLALIPGLCSSCVRQPGPAAPAQAAQDLLSGRYRVLPRPGATSAEDYFLTVKKSAEGWHVDDGRRVLSLGAMPREEVAGVLGDAAAQTAQCAAAAMTMLCATEPGRRIRENHRDIVFTTGYFFVVVDAGMWEMEKVQKVQ